MTIQEIAKKHGISAQAAYKRLKKAGIDIASLKDGSGKLTEEGVRKVLEVFPDDAPETERLKAELNRLTTEVEKLTTDNNQLSTEVERLKADNNRLTTQVEMMTGERDNLRTALEREQALTGLALQKIALPALEDSTRHKPGLKWFKGWFKKGGDDRGN